MVEFVELVLFLYGPLMLIKAESSIALKTVNSLLCKLGCDDFEMVN